MTEAIEMNDPIEATDANDPTLPIEAIDPTLPMDRIDPFDPIDRIESRDHSDQRDDRDRGRTVYQNSSKWMLPGSRRLSSLKPRSTSSSTTPVVSG